MERDNVSRVEINVHDGGQINFVKDSGSINAIQNNTNEDVVYQYKIKSRTQEYVDKWNDNMFLNDFDKRDENAGVNIKLNEVYLEEHLPHYTWGSGKNVRDDLKDLLKEYIYPHNDNKMLVILGQPGIGKSTLITWITANFTDRTDDILVYRFASDLGNIDWRNGRISYRVLEELGLSHSDLNGKILILDGFDEVSIESNSRRDILDSLYGDWIYIENIKKFSLIITCRENYVQEFAILKCKYITLRPWDESQIKSFCSIYQENVMISISDGTIEKLLENKEILGIPLILYMVLALNISIEKEGSIVDIYDKIFSLDGGIYDRCINNKKFAESHRIGDIKKQIHQISKDIAMWMFENNSEEAYISQLEYQKICSNVMKEQQKNENIEQDFLIGNFFKLVKHCEGIDSEELYFVHRSIYEYFVAETIYSSIEKALLKLSEESKKELAGNIAIYLKEGRITNTIGEYLQYMIMKLYQGFNSEKKERFYQWWESTVDMMMISGMFYYTQKNIYTYDNIIKKDTNCFFNLVKILRLLLFTSERTHIMESIEPKRLEKYIRLGLIFCGEDPMEAEVLDLRKMCLISAHLAGIDFIWANLEDADLRDADLDRADLRGTKLERSIWNVSDIQKIGLQLKPVHFNKILVNTVDGLIEVSKNELFSDEFILNQQ